MANNSAKFIDGSKIFHADACDPLVEAAKNGEIKLAAARRGNYPGEPLPEGVMEEVVSIGCWNASKNQSWGLPWHRNEGIEFTMIDLGKVAFEVEEQKFQLFPNNFTITRPWQRHRVGNPNITANRLYWIIIDVGVRQPHTEWKWPDWLLMAPQELQALTSILRGNESPVWQATAGIIRSFEKIRDLLENYKAEPNISRMKLHINELIMETYEMLKKSKHPLDTSLTHAQRTVELFLSDLVNHLPLEWTLETMAKHCGMGRSQFSNYTRKIINQSPMNYLIEVRVAAAKKMLQENTSLNITEIAMACGFQSAQYFATQFRKYTGISPRDFRRKLTE
jgi:AraC family L-rhamnose operon regulatory protein RhaS